ncbi:unnamed protein product, partial [Mesorhabditis spiculigera]
MRFYFQVQILLVDFGTSELVDMPATVRHIPPLSFPLVVRKPMLIGVREEEMRTTLKHARISVRLGSTTDGVVFNGDELRVFDKDSGELMPVNEAVHCASQLERVVYNINSRPDSDETDGRAVDEPATLMGDGLIFTDDEKP